MELQFTKSQNGLVPMDVEAQEWFGKVKAGGVVSAEFKKNRNPKFHRKFFALLKVAFDNWQQPEMSVSVGGKTVVPEKDFNRFRKDILILSGKFHTVFRVDGSYRVEADSISFASMDNEDFSELYQKVVQILIDRIYGSKFSPADVDKMVNAYLVFA